MEQFLAYLLAVVRRFEVSRAVTKFEGILGGLSSEKPCHLVGLAVSFEDYASAESTALPGGETLSFVLHYIDLAVAL